MNKGLEEELLNSGKRHWINFKDPGGETEREMFFCVEDYLMQKKALEIIKKTISTDLHFEYEEDTECWSVWIDCDGYQVYIFEGQGKEEYNLLREVLL